MKTKIKREKCSTELKPLDVTLQMSDQAFFDLAHQKRVLTQVWATKEGDEADYLEGILTLIEFIQDEAIEKGFAEQCVFPFK